MNDPEVAGGGNGVSSSNDNCRFGRLRYLSCGDSRRGNRMEMAQIRYVLAAAKHLNFTRAAADCASRSRR
jgi:hypothetical protein